MISECNLYAKKEKTRRCVGRRVSKLNCYSQKNKIIIVDMSINLFVKIMNLNSFTANLNIFLAN
jgi:hypothetical protein